MSTSEDHALDKNLFALWKGFLVLVLLILSWLHPSLSPFWDTIDQWFYLTFNQWLATSPLAQSFWAVMNTKAMDWGFDVLILGFAMVYIFPQKKFNSKRMITMLSCMLFGTLVILLINRMVIPILQLQRPSPTLAIGGFRLSQAIDWVSVKDISHNSFPGDHGTLAALFALTMMRLMKRTYGILALITSIIFTLPRLVVGAHWVSDIAIGSFFISYGSLNLLFYTGALKKWVSLISKKKEVWE